VLNVYLHSTFSDLEDLSIFNSFSVHGPETLDLNSLEVINHQVNIAFHVIF